MDWKQAALLFGSAVIGGGLNSVAGGGSFFTFPCLMFTGVPSIPANATSTVALWPGSVASVGAYREDLAAERHRLPSLLIASLIGGLIGAILLIKTPQKTFEFLIPWLLLLATFLFAFGSKLTAIIRKKLNTDQAHPLGFTGGIVLQLVVAIYGGYFGGGMGIMILSILALLGMDNIHRMNGMKALLGTAINGIAVVTFIYAGAVVWSKALFMILGAAAGGYGGAYYARKLDPKSVRKFVLIAAIGMTAYFFWKR